MVVLMEPEDRADFADAIGAMPELAFDTTEGDNLQMRALQMLEEEVDNDTSKTEQSFPQTEQ